jgi:hypothetical protein
VNISTPRFANIRKSCLDGVEGPDLAINELNSSAEGKKMLANRINFHDSLEGILRHISDWGQEIPCSTWITAMM